MSKNLKPTASHGNPLITVGILSYKDQKYLEKTIFSLLNQTYQNLEIIICDNNEDPEEKIKKWILVNFPTIKVVNAGGNVGFGKGHNFIINQAKGDFYLCYNSDLFAAPAFVENLKVAIEQDPKIALVTGKLLKWPNFPAPPDENKKKIDSTGLLITKSHSFRERGANQEDRGQFENQEEIWGASGAAFLARIEALQDIAHQIEEIPSENAPSTPPPSPEYFDKNFFMYKEDIDLMYRLRWAGWKCLYTPAATAWHDRTAEESENVIAELKKRKSRPAYIKDNSFLNHLQLLYKNWSTDYSWSVKIRTTIFLAKYFSYLLLFDRSVLKKLQEFKKNLKNLKAKRAQMPRRISASEMEKWFI